jgi:hypothetical protein
MSAVPSRAPFDGLPCVSYATFDVECDIATAWEILQDYPSWNPSFVGATVTHVDGPRGAEGETVRISKDLADPSGSRLPAFHATTVRMVPERHLVWYVFGDDGDRFRNFVDFGLTPTETGCRWDAYYYAQYAVEPDRLGEWTALQQRTLEETGAAFAEYCGARARATLHP